MKTGIHPKYYKTKVVCACGNVIETASTKGETFSVEICSACHPFFTGKIKLVDMAGPGDTFQKNDATPWSVQTDTKSREEAHADGHPGKETTTTDPAPPPVN